MSTVRRSYRIRAYPNGAQKRQLARWLGAARWLWNTALGIRSEGYRHCGLRLTGTDISRWLTQWKKTAGHEWLADVPATCLTQLLRDQDRAFANFFARRAKYPRFRRLGAAGALRFQDVSRAGWEAKELRLPKVGAVKLAEALPEITRPDMVTLRRDGAGRYFVSFGAEVEVAALAATGQAVGVDLGLTHLATLSTGEKVANPKRLAGRLHYLRRQQRILSRRQKGSRRRERQKQRVARAHARVAAQRENALHELTTRLVKENDTIVIEDLNVRALARGLHARAIADAAFGEFRRQLTYKCAWYGRKLIVTDRFFPSSKRCSNESCGHILDELRLDVREWRCHKCGALHDRDINAAKNLRSAGVATIAAVTAVVRVEGRGSCSEVPSEQVLPGEARSEQPSVARMARAALG